MRGRRLDPTKPSICGVLLLFPSTKSRGGATRVDLHLTRLSDVVGRRTDPCRRWHRTLVARARERGSCDPVPQLLPPCAFSASRNHIKSTRHPNTLPPPIPDLTSLPPPFATPSDYQHNPPNPPANPENPTTPLSWYVVSAALESRGSWTNSSQPGRSQPLLQHRQRKSDLITLRSTKLTIGSSKSTSSSRRRAR